MTRHQERTGLLFAALCAVNGAFVPALARLTTSRGTPLFVATATTVVAGFVATLVLWSHGTLRLLIRPQVAPRLLLVGVLGTAGAHWLFFLGASRATAIDAALCLQSEPAYSLILAWLFLHHRPTRRRAAAIVVLLVGITFTLGGAGIAATSGVWFLLVTPLCWQVSHLVVLRGLPGITPPVLAGARYIYGGIVIALVWVMSGAWVQLPNAADLAGLLPLLAVQGVVLSYVGTLLWYQAISRLDLARTTAIVVPSIPLLSLGASFLLLGEVPSAVQCIGLVLAAAGVLVFVTAPDALRTHAGAVVAAALEKPAQRGDSPSQTQ